jgi:hypothetical protein
VPRDQFGLLVERSGVVNLTQRDAVVELQDKKGVPANFNCAGHCCPTAGALDSLCGRVARAIDDNRFVIRAAMVALLAVCYNAYLVAVIVFTARRNGPGTTLDWCDGAGFLFAVTAVVYAALFYFQFVKRFYGKDVKRILFDPVHDTVDRVYSYRYSRNPFYALSAIRISLFTY